MGREEGGVKDEEEREEEKGRGRGEEGEIGRRESRRRKRGQTINNNE